MIKLGEQKMKIYMLGIGGVSMSALAIMLKAEGNEVFGSDEHEGQGTRLLKENNIEVDLPREKDGEFEELCNLLKTICYLKNNKNNNNKKNIKNVKKTIKTQKMRKNQYFYKNYCLYFSFPEINSVLFECESKFKNLFECDIVVRSSAIKDDDVRVLLASIWGKQILSRGQMLGKISEKYEKTVAVAGSHGKTTTTAMIYNILKIAGKNPTLHLGGYQIVDGKNFELGGDEFFVTEACEYYDNFLYLKPFLSVVTNIEREHLDYFGNFENEKKSFEKFKSNSKFVIDKPFDVKAKNIRHDKNGRLCFSLYNGEKKLMNLHLHLCEDINTINCVYAYLTSKQLGISDCYIKMGLENFKGVATRFERKKCPFFDYVICDYAHHPTEIQKSITSAKKIFKNKTIVTVFQPHTYSRTKELLNQFLKVFESVSNLVIFKTFSAREKESDGITGKAFVDILQNKNKNVKYFDNFSSLKEFLLNFSKKDTVLVFLGAGDLPQILTKEKFITDN